MLFFAGHVDEDASKPEDISIHPTLAKWVRDWPSASDFGFVAVDDATDTPLGATWVRFFSDADGNTGYINDQTAELAIAVEPDHLGRGIGTLLLTNLLEEAERRGCDLSLTVRTSNPAYRLYERVGFTVLRKVVNRVGTTSYLMVYTVEQPD